MKYQSGIASHKPARFSQPHATAVAEKKAAVHYFREPKLFGLNR
jgi:hypothetical protein